MSNYLNLESKVNTISRIPVIITRARTMHTAKVANYNMQLEGKSPAQKEKILRELAMNGSLLPEGKTPVDRMLIAKVRADLSLPPEPKSIYMRNKHAKAANAGLLVPLEGKTTKEKEKILKGLCDMGIPLPEGGTASEKALIAKVKAESCNNSNLVSSDKKRQIKPPSTQTEAQKYKMLRDLAMNGTPLPEGHTPIETKLIAKIRTDLGLPPEPKTAFMKKKYAKAAEAGLLQPLEGKTVQEKEKILKGLAEMGVLLPDGRTQSEKGLIAKVKAEFGTSSTVPPVTEKIRKTKLAGIPRHVEGKGVEPEEKIKSTSIKEKNANIGDAGLLQTLEGKTLEEKENILRALADMGVQLPNGRTASEKTLITKVKEKICAVKATNLQGIQEKEPTEQSITTPRIKSVLSKEGLVKELEKCVLSEGEIPSDRKLIDENILRLVLLSDPIKEHFAKSFTGSALPQSQETLIQKLLLRILEEIKMEYGGKLPETLSAFENAPIPNDAGLEEAPLANEEAIITIEIPSKENLTRKERCPNRSKSSVEIISSKKNLTRKERCPNRSKSSVEIFKTNNSSKERIVKSREHCIRVESKSKAKSALLIAPLSDQLRENKQNMLTDKSLIRYSSEGNIALGHGLKKNLSSALHLTILTTSEGKRSKTESGLTLKTETRQWTEKIIREWMAAGLLSHDTQSEKQNIILSSLYSDKVLSNDLEGEKLPAIMTQSQRNTTVQDEEYMENPSKLCLSHSKVASEKNCSEEKQNNELDILLTTLSAKGSNASAKVIPNMYTTSSQRVFSDSLLTTYFPSEDQSTKDNIIESLTDGVTYLTESIPSKTDCKVENRTKVSLSPGLTSSESGCKAKNEDLFPRFASNTNTEGYKMQKYVTEAEHNISHSNNEYEGEMLHHLTSSQKQEIQSKRNGIMSEARIGKEFEDNKRSTCDRGCGYIKKKIRFKHSYINIITPSSHITSTCSCSDKCKPVGTFGDNEGSKVNAIALSLIFKKDNVVPDCSTVSSHDKIKTNTVANKRSMNSINILYDKNRQINHLSNLSIVTVKTNTGVESLNTKKGIKLRSNNKSWEKEICMCNIDQIRDYHQKRLSERSSRNNVHSNLILARSVTDLTSTSNTSTSYGRAHKISVDNNVMESESIHNLYYLVSDSCSTTTNEISENSEECYRRNADCYEKDSMARCHGRTLVRW